MTFGNKFMDLLYGRDGDRGPNLELLRFWAHPNMGNNALQNRNCFSTVCFACYRTHGVSDCFLCHSSSDDAFSFRLHPKARGAGIKYRASLHHWLFAWPDRRARALRFEFSCRCRKRYTLMFGLGHVRHRHGCALSSLDLALQWHANTCTLHVSLRIDAARSMHHAPALQRPHTPRCFGNSTTAHGFRYLRASI